MKKTILAAVATAAFSLATPAMAEGDHVGKMKELASQVSSWLNSPAVLDAVKAQNAANASLSQDQIIALDKQWRSESSGGGPLVDKVLANNLSKYLAEVKEKSGGLFTEIFVMDNKGLNVGQSDVTSDYWQGDEGKWQNTFLKGPDAVDVGEVEQDESTQTFQSQLSLPISYQGKNIGAVTIGVDMEALDQ